MLKDPYETLGIGREATAEEIRLAYRAGVKTMHPDAGGGAEAFQDLGEAQRLLLDPARRARFDATGDIDSSEPDNSEARVFAVIASIIELAMKTDGAEDRDVVLGIKQTITHRILKMNELIGEHKQAIAKLRKVGKRFRRKKKGANLIRRMFESRVSNHEQQVRMIEVDLAAHRAALLMMDGYEYDWEPAAPQQRPPSLLQRFGTTTRA